MADMSAPPTAKASGSLSPAFWLAFAAINACLAVIAGALGAHLVPDFRTRDWLRTGSDYALLHSLAILVCIALRAHLGPARSAALWAFGLGIVCFSGALYALAAGAPRVITAFAPIGGLGLISGWILLALAAFQRGKADRGT